jgi:hypothetical protein
MIRTTRLCPSTAATKPRWRKTRRKDVQNGEIDKIQGLETPERNAIARNAGDDYSLMTFERTHCRKKDYQLTI